ncbi:MAG: right-handed parallel beta-helix repeat-containing protein [Clostridium sp.]|uniref:right-handed parallel beta-helix repeat-containing protein n=1 Tax=Clostridium sp. TaxID=1506 RepID=UPI003D6D1E33
MIAFFKKKSTIRVTVTIVIAITLSITYLSCKKTKDNYKNTQANITKVNKVSKASSIAKTINISDSFKVFQTINMDVNNDGFIDLVELSKDGPDSILFSIKDGKDNSIMGKLKFYQYGDKTLTVIPGDFYGYKSTDFFIKRPGYGYPVSEDNFLISFKGNELIRVPLIDTELDNGINIDENVNYELKDDAIRFWSKNINFNTNIKLSPKQIELYKKNENTARRNIGFGEANLEPKDVDKDGVFELEYTTDFHISKRQQIAAITSVFKYLDAKWKLISVQIKPATLNKEENNKTEKPIAEVTVSNVEELVDAIGSNKHIKLRKGIYNVSKIKDMVSKNKKINFVHEEYGYGYGYGYDTCILKTGVNYVDVTDGKELAIYGVNNLTIEGQGDEYVQIVAEPRDSYIFQFNNSDNITLKNLKIGHTIKDEAFICNAGVIKVINSQNFNVSNCLLYGCGTIGIYAYDVDNLNFDNSIIEKCTMGIMDVDSSTNINFTNSKLRKSKEYTMICLNESQSIKFSNCEIADNNVISGRFAFMSGSNTKNVEFLKCKFERNSAEVFMNAHFKVDFKGCTFGENRFDGKW